VFERDTSFVFDVMVRKTQRNEPDVRGSVHHTTIHKEKSNKLQQFIKILLLHIYLKLNMFRVIHRPSSGSKNCTGSLWFFIRGRLLDV